MAYPVLLAACVALLGTAAAQTAPALRGAAAAAATTAGSLLQGISPSVGVLSPAFAPGVNRYEVLVRTPHTESLELVLELAPASQGRPEEVLVDGVVVPRGSDGAAHVPVELGAGGVPVERTLEIRVSDGAQGAAPQALTVRVARPPDFGALVRPVKFRVLDEEGQELQGAPSPGLGPRAPVAGYEYPLPPRNRRVGVELECQEPAWASVWGGGSEGFHATALKAEGGVHWVTMDGSDQVISGQCLYQDPTWTKGGIVQGRTYVLSFRQSGTSIAPAPSTT